MAIKTTPNSIGITGIAGVAIGLVLAFLLLLTVLLGGAVLAVIGAVLLAGSALSAALEPFRKALHGGRFKRKYGVTPQEWRAQQRLAFKSLPPV